LFHGGEPLLEFDEIQNCLSYCAAKSGTTIRYAIQSNASLLDQRKYDLLRRHGVGLCFSVDGTDERANRLRVNAYDQNCYRLLLDKTARIAGLSPGSVGLLFTVGAHNADSLLASICRAQADGFRSVSFSLMHAVTPDAVATSAASLLRLYLRIVDGIQDGAISDVAVWPVINWIRKVIYGKSDSVCYSSPCGAGRNLITVLPSGELSPCDSIFSHAYYHANLQQFKAAQNRPSKLRSLTGRTVDGLRMCKDCDVRVFCNGTCPGNAILQHATADAVHEEECLFQYELIRAFIWKLCSPASRGRLLEYVKRHVADREMLISAH
jgi:uncharacterized protein